MNPNGIARGERHEHDRERHQKAREDDRQAAHDQDGVQEQAQERVGVPRLDPRLLLEVRFELIEGGDRHHVDDGNAVNLMLGPVRKRIGARALHRAAGCRKHDAIDLEAEEPPRRSRFVERQAEGLPVLLDLGLGERALHEVLARKHRQAQILRLVRRALGNRQGKARERLVRT